jgi:hypothetical protein
MVNLQQTFKGPIMQASLTAAAIRSHFLRQAIFYQIAGGTVVVGYALLV